jgi:diaminohydroxyphosphoribosylaminopyrimidine deaminase/5-amino-6-(5-phosphoribosylamino)uracil reductase
MLNSQSVDDLSWMQRARALAERGAGHVSPNPLVGCVVVSERGDVLGEGWHARYGERHAEPAALADARSRGASDADLQAATVYVTLEPCAHWGKTPPCADLLAETAPRRVVVGLRDPFPAVDGKGIERLRAAGIEVTCGVDAEACWRQNEAFVHHVTTGRPLVTLKIAQTLDGFSATHSGDSQWVTGEQSRAHVHRLRATLDAVLVGSGTALADDPRLTVRLASGRQPGPAHRRRRARGPAR